jgi:hypothetical protein
MKTVDLGLMSSKRASRCAAISLAALVPALFAGCASDSIEPGAPTATITAQPTAPPSRIVAARRLTESQYRSAIKDVFGPDVVVNVRFEPEVRSDSLLAIGADTVSISANGLEGYFAAARSISQQALTEKNRSRVVTCALPPEPAKVRDDPCLKQIVSSVGAQLFRRPIDPQMLAPRLTLAADVAEQTGKVDSGLESALVSLLTAPDFLFRIERAEAQLGANDTWTLDPYSRAARISFLLWDAPPDKELLAAAQSRDLMTEAGLKTQVDRLLASPRVEQGVRAFFTDYLQLDRFDGLTKDAAQYPKFSPAVAAAAREQTLRVVLAQVMRENADFREIFTTRDTFIDRSLGAIYRVPYAAKTKDEWVPYTFDEESGQSGVLTQVTFNSLFSHPARSSPTKRGVAVNEIFRCIIVPQPPADVDLSKLSSAANTGKTVRDRLIFHRSEPMCSGCHMLTDPAGLALEHFDGIGQHRLTENGAVIDVSSDFFGAHIDGARGLGEFLRNDPNVPACLVNRLRSFGTGRAPASEDQAAIDAMVQEFISDGFNVIRAMARLAASPASFTVPASLTSAPGERT